MALKYTELPMLFTEKQIQDQISILAKKMNHSLKDQELILVPVLNGALQFASALSQKLTILHKIDFIQASSYGQAQESSGKVEIIKDISEDISGKVVILIEDIIDTGLTINELIIHLKKRNPQKIMIVSLLVKSKKHFLSQPIDYFGFEIEDEFVVGFGLDFKGYLRNLPYIAYVPKGETLEI